MHRQIQPVKSSFTDEPVPIQPPLGYVCDWLPPDFGAVGQYSEIFARQLAASGWRRVILIGLSSGEASTTVEAVGGGTLTTIRLAARPVPKHRLDRRLLWTLWVNLRLAFALAVRLPSCGKVIFTGSPPFMIFFLTPLRWLRGYSMTYRITDLHPECLMASMKRVPWPVRLLYRQTVRLRRRIDEFEVLGEDQRRQLEQIGIDPARIRVKRDPSPVDFTAGARPLQVPDGAEGRAILLYSGNFGKAHDIDTFAEGYIRHHKEGSGQVLLWLNATGEGADELTARIEAAGCPVARGHPVPLEELASLLLTPHAHLITLKDEFVGLVVPSKIYACVESGKDIVYVGSRRSDVHLIAQERKGLGQLYCQIDVGDVPGVVQVLESVASRHATRSSSEGTCRTSTSDVATVPERRFINEGTRR
jgi:hypothetical protein